MRDHSRRAPSSEQPQRLRGPGASGTIAEIAPLPAASARGGEAARSQHTAGLKELARDGATPRSTLRVAGRISVKSYIDSNEPVTEAEIRLVLAVLGDTLADILKHDPEE
jgi:hypothetical protein